MVLSLVKPTKKRRVLGPGLAAGALLLYQDQPRLLMRPEQDLAATVVRKLDHHQLRLQLQLPPRTAPVKSPGCVTWRAAQTRLAASYVRPACGKLWEGVGGGVFSDPPLALTHGRQVSCSPVDGGGLQRGAAVVGALV